MTGSHQEQRCAKALAIAGVDMIEQVFLVLFSRHLATEETRQTYREYSNDFWRRFHARMDEPHGSS